jgi:polyhydroxybutyrate depolymerase
MLRERMAWLAALTSGLLLLAAACAGSSAQVQTASPDGCGRARPPGTTIGSMLFQDLNRSYRLHIPASYDGSTPTPLVLNFHGYGSNARDQEAYSGMVSKANTEGFITVAPEGIGSPQRWHVYGESEPGYVDDVAFVEALLDSLIGGLCMDPDRIYATGMSNGAAMSVQVACRLGGRIAAIAPVAGVYFPIDCLDVAPVPIVAFHGTGDDLVPFDAGRGGRYSLPTRGVRPTIADWAKLNGCERESQPTRIEPDILVETYTDCIAEVVLYIVEDGGHSWPGARSVLERFGKTTRTISATDVMWEFFQANPREP